jgi:hypothetical protein
MIYSRSGGNHRSKNSSTNNIQDNRKAPETGLYAFLSRGGSEVLRYKHIHAAALDIVNFWGGTQKGGGVFTFYNTQNRASKIKPLFSFRPFPVP